MEITFGAFRKYVSVIDPVSICFYETSAYENYDLIRDVPAEYDSLFIYGVGLIESEFGDLRDWKFKKCIEIVLSKEPRADFE